MSNSLTGKEVVIHKTFHNYTVRAKQGGSQGAKDNQSGTAHPKSSGASLRRYNEQSQRQVSTETAFPMNLCYVFSVQHGVVFKEICSVYNVT